MMKSSEVTVKGARTKKEAHKGNYHLPLIRMQFHKFTREA